VGRSKQKVDWACLLLLITESNYFFILTVRHKDFNSPGFKENITLLSLAARINTLGIRQK